MRRRVRFGTGGVRGLFIVDDDDEDSDSDRNLFFFGGGAHEFPEVVRRMMKNRVLFSTEGGNWMDEFLVRISGRDGWDGRNLGRRIRDHLQLREVHEHGEDRGNQGVRDLQHEVEALRDRIRDLERAIERLGRRRR